MTRRALVGMAAFWVVVGLGCSSDEGEKRGSSGGSAGSPGSAGTSSGSSGTGAGGVSGSAGQGGTPGGGGSAGNGGTDGAACEQMCEPETRIACPAADFQGCVGFCRQSLAEKPECREEVLAAAECAGLRPASDFECDADGAVSLKGEICAVEQEASCVCLLGASLCP
jgi:hypothetical protein